MTDAAHLLGWLVFHPWSSQHSAAGFPDLTLVRPGRRVIFVELKSTHGVLSSAQAVWRDALLACPGVDFFLWRPADWLAGTILEVLR